MRNKSILTALFPFLMASAIGQSSQKVSIFLNGQINTSIYSAGIRNGVTGPGFGLQTFINTKSKFKPMADLTVDILINSNTVYFEQDERLVFAEGTMVNLFAGVSYHPNQRIFFSLAGGPTLYDGKRTILGTKGSFGFYFSKNQRWMGKFSAIYLFNQEPVTKDDLGLVSAGVGLRLY